MHGVLKIVFSFCRVVNNMKIVQKREIIMNIIIVVLTLIIK